MVWELLKNLFKQQFGADLLAAISMLTAIALREYLVATIVMLMLPGGEALEGYATAKASSNIGGAGAAHAKRGTSQRSERISPTCS
jgi:cation transport ATPase